MRYLWIIGLFLCSVVSADPIRVVYRPDGTVAIIAPADKTNTKAVFDETIARTPSLQGLPYDDMDSSQLPESDGKYWIGEKDKGVKIDTARKNADKQAKKDKEDKVKAKLGKLGLTEEDLNNLKEILQ